MILIVRIEINFMNLTGGIVFMKISGGSGNGIKAIIDRISIDSF